MIVPQKVKMIEKNLFQSMQKIKFSENSDLESICAGTFERKSIDQINKNIIKSYIYHE